MLALANILFAIAGVLKLLINMMIIIIIARAVISWVNADPYNPIVRFLSAASDPLLNPLRRYIPLVGGGIDITPIVLLLILFFIDIAVVQTISDYATQMRLRNLSGLPTGA